MVSANLIPFSVSAYNGMNRSAAFHDHEAGDRKRRNYKLVADPMLNPGVTQKVYRFDGVLAGVRADSSNNNHNSDTNSQKQPQFSYSVSTIFTFSLLTPHRQQELQRQK